MKSWMNEQEENKPVATYVIKADPTKQSGVPQAFDKFNKHSTNSTSIFCQHENLGGLLRTNPHHFFPGNKQKIVIFPNRPAYTLKDLKRPLLH